MEANPEFRGTVGAERSCAGLGFTTPSAPKVGLFHKQRARRVTIKQAQGSILTAKGTAPAQEEQSRLGGHSRVNQQHSNPQKVNSDETALRSSQKIQPTSAYLKESLS